jgi:methionine aminopeptidase
VEKIKINQMSLIKSERELEIMRWRGRLAAEVLDEVAAFIRPGMTTRQVDEFAGEAMKKRGAKSAFLGYRKYPCQTCLSVNDEVVHGLANERQLTLRRHCEHGLRGDVTTVLSVIRQRRSRLADVGWRRSG